MNLRHVQVQVYTWRLISLAWSKQKSLFIKPRLQSAGLFILSEWHKIHFWKTSLIPVKIMILERCWSDIDLDIAIVNESHGDVNLPFNLTSGSWDWTNQILISPWHCCNNGRYPVENSSVSATRMPRLYCGNWN